MNKNQELAEYLKKWSLSEAKHIAATPRATVWRVRLENGNLAALKIATGPDKASEAGADAVLAAFDGHGMIRCLRSDRRGWLLDWVEGPLLGDVARAGDLTGADRELVTACANLHRAARTAPAGIPTLLETCAPLRRFDTARCTSTDDAVAFGAAQDRLKVLEAHPQPTRLLHGDFHHDNVGRTPGGLLVFDPKGVVGELAYEPANCFGNPVGLEEEARDPARVVQLADALADTLQINRTRILGWAVVHAALSMVWALEDGWDDAFARVPLLVTLLDTIE